MISEIFRRANAVRPYRVADDLYGFAAKSFFPRFDKLFKVPALMLKVLINIVA